MIFKISTARIAVCKLVSFALLLTLSQQSQAAFVLMIDDDLDALNGRTTVIDGDADGLINYIGGYGDFSVVVTTGVTQPTLASPAKLDLNSIEVTGATGGTLYLWLTNTDFFGSESNFTADFGGTTQGSVSFDFLYDTANTEFGGIAFASGDSASSIVGGTAFANSLNGSVTPGDPYSLTIFATVDHLGGGQVTSFDALVTTVPIPATAWLFGSAFVGLISSRRKHA